MKTKFTKDYIIDNRGCYSIDKVHKIKCIDSKTITIDQLFRDLPIRDFCWWLVKKCDLTLNQKRQFAVYCAEYVLPIFEKEYPKDDRPRKAIEAAKKVIDNDSLENRSAAYDASYFAADAARNSSNDVRILSAYAAYASSYACYASYFLGNNYGVVCTLDNHVVYASDAALDSAVNDFREHIYKFVKQLKID
jgi:hypothetical protein